MNQPEYPKRMYHASQESVMVNSAKAEAELGKEWSEDYLYRPYPKCRYHLKKEPVNVQNADEEAALGGGWGDQKDILPYRDTRPQRPEQHDVLKWVDEWQVPQLLSDVRKKIQAQLLRADAEFWRSRDDPKAVPDSMRQAFQGIAKVLFEAGILTEELLRNEIPQLVWDSAIAGGWYRFASEVPKNIFPERIGHYYVWRDETQDWKALFHSEIRESMAALLEAPRRKSGRGACDPGSKLKTDPHLEQLRKTVREFREAGMNYRQICERLGDRPRPPGARWRDLPWPMAYKRHHGTVTKWLSAACAG